MIVNVPASPEQTGPSLLNVGAVGAGFKFIVDVNPIGLMLHVPVPTLVTVNV